MDIYALIEEAIKIIKDMLERFKGWIDFYFPQEEE